MAKRKPRKNRNAIKSASKKEKTHEDSKGFLARSGKTAIVLALIPIVFLIYSNTLNAPFILDDGDNIRNNPHIRMTHLSFESLMAAGSLGFWWFGAVA